MPGKGSGKGKAKGKGKTSKEARREAAIAAGRAKAAERRRRKAADKEKFKERFATDLRVLRGEVGALGLGIRMIEADGNCLFRAVSDQLTGSQGDHWDLRCRTVDFMAAHEDDFRPFVDTDEYGSWEEYLADMAGEGEWGGNLELVALGRALGVNLCVYQAGAPRWEIDHFGPRRRRLHVGYLDGCHYHSVCLAGFEGSVDAPPNFAFQDGAAVACEYEEAGGEGDGAVGRVCAALVSPPSEAVVRLALERTGGDEEAALLAIQCGEVAEADAAEAARGAGAARPGGGRAKPKLSRKEAKKARRRAAAAARIAAEAAGEAASPSGRGAGGREAEEGGGASASASSVAI